MSAFVDCIKSRLEAGEITPEQLARVEELVGEAKSRGLSDSEIGELAEARTSELLSKQRRRSALQASKMVSLEELRKAHPLGEASAESVKQFLASDFIDRSVSDNVNNRSDVAFREFLSDFADGVEALRSKMAGLTRDKELSDDVVRALFGQDVKNPKAREIAESYRAARKKLHERFNRAGGESPFNADNVVPQYHDMQRVANARRFNELRKAGKSVEEANAAVAKEWKDFIRPLLDRKKMIDVDTDLPFSDEGLDALLDEVHESIRTGGLNKVQESSSLRRGAGRFDAKRRVLWFKDGDSWLTYQQRFGESDPFQAMIREAQGTARSTALLEILGPNPDATMNFLVNRFEKALEDVRKGASGSDLTQLNNVFNSRNSIMEVYDSVNGRLALKVNAGLNHILGSARSVTISALIGSAAIPSMTDVARLNLARQFISAPQKSVLGDLARFFNPRSAEDIAMATRKGVVMEVSLGEMLAEGRYAVGNEGGKLVRKLPGFVIRASGLETLTDKMRFMGATDFLDTLSHHIELGRKWGELPPELRGWLGTKGFNGNDWRALSAIAMDDIIASKSDKFKFLNLKRVAEKNGRLGDLVHSSMLDYLELVSPTGNPRIQAGLTLGTQAGTIAGEAARTGKIFSSFPILALQGSFHRIWSSPVLGEKAFHQRLGIFAKYFATLTTISAMAYQFREISKGRDPRSMDDPKFWYQAMLQSGGLSIYGDFLDSLVGENRYGDSVGQTALGPVVRNVDDGLNVAREAFKAATGQKNSLGDRAVRFTQGVTPGANLWYTRLVTDRLLFDQMRLLLDPRAPEKFRRMERRLRQETGQEYWLPPGAGELRPPNLAEALK